MKPTFLIAVVVALVASAGCRQAPPDPRTQITQEYAATDAGIVKGDADAACANFSPDYVFIGLHNQRLNLATTKELMQMLAAKGLKFTSRTSTITDFQLQPGNNAAIVTISADITETQAGRSTRFINQFRDYWIKSPDDKTWLIKQSRVLLPPRSPVT